MGTGRSVDSSVVTSVVRTELEPLEEVRRGVGLTLTVVEGDDVGAVWGGRVDRSVVTNVLVVRTDPELLEEVRRGVVDVVGELDEVV